MREKCLEYVGSSCRLPALIKLLLPPFPLRYCSSPICSAPPTHPSNTALHTASPAREQNHCHLLRISFRFVRALLPPEQAPAINVVAVRPNRLVSVSLRHHSHSLSSSPNDNSAFHLNKLFQQHKRPLIPAYYCPPKNQRHQAISTISSSSDQPYPPTEPGNTTVTVFASNVTRKQGHYM